ncbi:ATPase component of general energizing module of ECF transporters [Sporolactobacillus inulinus]|nr:hypothetical protein [Sporolactobacillus inulinus]GAY77129.1 ATPase component of general energizing module of ECF transporters [Sporolactobacillus inulinus]
MDDRPEHVFYQIDLLKQLKLDVPQVVALVLRLRQQGIRLPDPIIHVEQCIDALTAVREEDYGTY